MTPWMETSINVQNALKVDIKSWLTNEPQNPYTQLWLKHCGGVWQIPAEKIFESNWLNKFEKLTDLKVDVGLVFFREADYQHPNAHIDVEPLSNEIYSVSASFNWVLDYDCESKMIWYEPWWNADDADECKAAAYGLFPHPSLGYSTHANHAAMLYQETPTHLLKEINSHSLSNTHLTLVRTDIPHNIKMGPSKRWAITLRSFGSLPNTWKSCVDRYCYCKM